MVKPALFIDEQAKGDFRMLKHVHHFKPCDNGTIMIDLLSFETPYGAVGRLFNAVYFNRYMRNLVTRRNNTIKEYAETDKWKRLLMK
jgi:ligand-binding SRPBCC domain-containing protein